MPLSSRVRDELSRRVPAARRCRIAEVAAILGLCGRVGISTSDHFVVEVHTENVAVAGKYFILLKETFNISTDVSIRRGGNLSRNRVYVVAVREHDDTLKVLQMARLIDDQGETREDLSLVCNVVIQNARCRRAFIRGVFLASGPINDPEKLYHFEIICSSMAKVEQLKGIVAAFDMRPKIVLRKKCYVVYVKEGNQIVDTLNVMEAPVSLMGSENIRILREMRGNVNHQVNCEIANINKTVSVAVEQMEDIHHVQDTIGLGELPEGLQDVVYIRLKRPEATLKELGKALEPPVGKSGINHRLRKPSQIVDDMQQQLPRKQYGVYSLMYH